MSEFRIETHLRKSHRNTNCDPKRTPNLSIGDLDSVRPSKPYYLDVVLSPSEDVVSWVAANLSQSRLPAGGASPRRTTSLLLADNELRRVSGRSRCDVDRSAVAGHGVGNPRRVHKGRSRRYDDARSNREPGELR